MTIRIRTAIAAAASIMLAGAAVPAAAQTESNVAPNSRAGGSNASTRTATADPNERVCVRFEISGSRIRREVCQTRAEWARDGGIPTVTY
jgi:hypothetical protein